MMMIMIMMMMMIIIMNAHSNRPKIFRGSCRNMRSIGVPKVGAAGLQLASPN
jgi:hypothetical protein